MEEPKRLKDVLELGTPAFFTAMETAAETIETDGVTPWGEFISGEELDVAYYLNNFNRYISPWMELLQTAEEKPDIERIAQTVYKIYRRKWWQLFDIWRQEYNPLENYDRQEDTTKTLDKTGKEKTKRTPDITRTFEKEGEEENKRNRNTTDTDKTLVASEDTATNKRAAFNSSDMLNVGGQELRHTDSREQKGTGDITDTLKFTGRKDTEKQTGTDDTELSFENRKDTERVTGRIHGNIGVTTAAQMIIGEKDAWSALKLIEEVLFNDLSKQIALSIY